MSPNLFFQSMRSTDITNDTLRRLIDHVALPPEVPQREETQERAVEDLLLDTLVTTADELETLDADGSYGLQSCCWRIRNLLSFCKELSDSDFESSLRGAFAHFDIDDHLPIFLRAQNAALVLRHHRKFIIFEAFEVSADSWHVMNATDALLRSFPDKAISVPFDVFQDDGFRHELVSFLQQARFEEVPEFQASSRKARVDLLESRETTNPALITDLLMVILEAFGEPASSTKTRKRVRDEVCWFDAQNPWRRLPMWLVIRVTLQRMLISSYGFEMGVNRYKNFVAVYLAHCCHLATENDLPIEIIDFLLRKTSRRLFKLGERLFKPLRDPLMNIINAASIAVSNHALQVQRECSRQIPPIDMSTYPLDDDIKLSLDSCKDFLTKVLAGTQSGSTQTPRSLQRPQRIKLGCSEFPDPSLFSTINFDVDQLDLDRLIFLADIEEWVERYLISWCNGKIVNEILTKLGLLFDLYGVIAVAAYENNPEQVSVMLLTLLEIWVVMDQEATKSFPLLLEHSPPFPIGPLEVLCLANFKDMKRLSHVENYVRTRHSKSLHSSILSKDGTLGFAVRYYDTHEELDRVYRDITNKANHQAAAKKNELKHKNQEFHNLKEQARSISQCTFDRRYTRNAELVNTHSPNCPKCKLQDRADAMAIAVHEWPLPDNDLKRKLAVFELRLPSTFGVYRDVCWKLLHGYFHCRSVGGGPAYGQVRTYCGLREFSAGPAPRLTLASTTKSFLVTHYKARKMPANERDVLFPCALQYKLIDKDQMIWIDLQLGMELSLKRHLHIPLPESPYSAFQGIADGLRLTPNEAIARQTECPPSISLHTFNSITDLRPGEHALLLKLCREMASPYLELREPCVIIILAKIIYQAGPPNKTGSSRRCAFALFEKESVCTVLLGLMQQRFDDAKSNWKESHVVRGILMIVSRMKSLTTSLDIRPGCSQLLGSIRSTALTWARHLKGQFQLSSNESLARKAARRALCCAVLCILTYHSEEHSLDTFNAIGSAHTTALVDYLEALRIMHDFLPTVTNELPVWLSNDIFSARKIARFLEPLVFSTLQASVNTISAALERCWPGERFYGDWKAEPSPNSCWFRATITTPSTFGNAPGTGTVQFNILDGNFLVDGVALGRLPHAFTQNDEYKLLFGTQILDVYPAKSSGLTYVSSAAVHGNEIYFGTRRDRTFIRARKGAADLELIPRDAFTRNTYDLPLTMIEDCVHWLDLKDGLIEIRPIKSLWRSSRENWVVDLRSRVAYIPSLTGPSRYLVDVRSTTFTRFSKAVAPIELREYVVATLSSQEAAANRVTLHLPRAGLHFEHTNEGLLKCPELGAKIDTDQNIGTLFGLESKLVLRNEVQVEERIVLVPTGKILVENTESHRHMRISSSGKCLKLRQYRINHVLGSLDTGNELSEQLFVAYLHALTAISGCPDPLTNRIGTEEALRILEERRCWPSSPLSKTDVEILQRIAELSPIREFYPEHKQTMQRVQWLEWLPADLQRPEFRDIAFAIIDSSERYSALYPGLQSEATLPSGSTYLVKRALSRDSLYLNPECRPTLSRNLNDVLYVSREASNRQARVQRVFQTASTIRDWTSKIELPTDLYPKLEALIYVDGYHETFHLTSFSELFALNFSTAFGALFRHCQQARKPTHRFSLAFLFSKILFSPSVNMDLSKVLLATALTPESHSICPPVWPRYEVDQGPKVAHGDIFTIAYQCQVDSPREQRCVSGSNMERQGRARDYQTHVERVQDACQQLSQRLLEQWPCERPSFIQAPPSNLVDNEQLVTNVSSLFLTRFKNLLYQQHIRSLEAVLKAHCHKAQIFKFSSPRLNDDDCRQNGQRTILPDLTELLNTCTLLARSDVLMTMHPRPLAPQRPPKRSHPEPLASRETFELKKIVGPFASSDDITLKAYAEGLQASIHKLEQLEEFPFPCAISESVGDLEVHANMWKDQVNFWFDVITLNIEKDPRSVWLKAGKLWPRLSISSLLKPLASNSDLEKTAPIVDALLKFGRNITLFQKQQRLLKAARRKDAVTFWQEFHNNGHELWKLEHHPDWLLLEIESDLLIRPEQLKVAQEMIQPTSFSGNIALQLNMGQGKSSVIVPMVATALADSLRLVRVIVPKTLLPQMTGSLRSRISGLLGRRVLHIPFSREIAGNPGAVESYMRLHSDAQSSKAVVVTVVESMMSFKLSGVERLSCGDIALGEKFIRFQRTLQASCRDIVDEVDYVLGPKTQLIYPTGTQLPMDGHPIRWKVVQEVLGLVQRLIRTAKQLYPKKVQVEWSSSGRYPLVYQLDEPAKEGLLTDLVQAVCEGNLPSVPVHHCTSTQLEHVAKFLLETECCQDTVAAVKICFQAADQQKSIYLLRGLLGRKILTLCLLKRWNVQYGSHPHRCLLAVPYVAKGKPSERAEFGHPEITLVLTCLSFYYSGLRYPQFQQCLKILLDLDDPSIEYDRWVSARVCGINSDMAPLPEPLRSWKSINPEDDIQMVTLFEYLRHSVDAINFFLNQVVFPREARVFEKKLVTSAWDIPSGTPSSTTLTAGFSGTNDLRSLLPLTIKQTDLPHLQHTNAEVLRYLLEPRNRHYMLAKKGEDKMPVEEFLGKVNMQTPRISVLLDAGAQILEMENRDVVKHWLSISPHAAAGVFLNDRDQLIVLHHDGLEEPFQSSLYVNDLGTCIVYLDEAHIRGIDLKFPSNARAAVTLGPNLSKDSLVQACMRLRKLKHDQSVCFFAPPEVDRGIRDIVNKVEDVLSSADVITWVIEQTCKDLRSKMPLYIAQGLNFCKRNADFKRLPSQLPRSALKVNSMIQGLQDPEVHSTESLYAPRVQQEIGSDRKLGGLDSTDPLVQDLKLLESSLNDHDALANASIHEEQERELEVEVEEENQVERPPLKTPEVHRLDESVRCFVKSGIWIEDTGAWVPAHCVLNQITKVFGEDYEGLHRIFSTLFVTRDFMRTVRFPPKKGAGDYLRPVEWLVWSQKSPHRALVLSPYEAEALLPLFRDGKSLTHLLTYSAPATRIMLCFDDLKFQALPSLPSDWRPPYDLKRDVGLFAGRLFFRYEEYVPLMRYLGCAVDRHVEEWGAGMELTMAESPFEGSILPLISHLTTLRRKKQDWDESPLGVVVRHRELQGHESFFQR